MMKRFALGCLILLLSVGMAVAQVDKQNFYKVFSSGEEDSIENMLTRLENQKTTSKTNAYIGALTMQKAGYVKGLSGKLKTFKKGAALLEDEIKNNPDNTEYRFLRLAIQEHAPGILKYNKEIDTDRKAIVSGYDKLDAGLKSVIAGYAKDSKVLNESDLR